MLVLGDIWEFQAAVSSGDSSAVPNIFFVNVDSDLIPIESI